jgi:fructokinase
MNRLCIFGEVLFDHFPDGKSVLGGAPFNVAWHLQAFGQAPNFISRVGDDAEGQTVRAAMQRWGMDISSLQADNQHPTGKVTVTFVDGEPDYDIVRPCAYDAIEAQPQAADCGLLYHGSLALRETASRQALKRLMASRPKTVFVDVNLRAPWYQLPQVSDMLHGANWVKLNSDELNLLYPSSKSRLPRAVDFLSEYGLSGLVVTHGAEGAELITDNGEHYTAKPEQDIKVVDTVGAGDAFASVIILGLNNDWPLDITLQRAQLFASYIVGNRGATVSDAGFYQQFIKQWNLAV